MKANPNPEAGQSRHAEQGGEAEPAGAAAEPPDPSARAEQQPEREEAEQAEPQAEPQAEQEAEHGNQADQDGQGAQGEQGSQGGGTERLEQAVRAAEHALIEYEIAVETFRVEVENFSRLHHQRLAPMYTRLDELDAEIAETQAALTGDPEDARRAEEARAAVLPMPRVEELFHGWVDSEGMPPEATAMLNEQSVRPPSRVRPGEEARKAYRELVRKAHPDLAQDDAERERREEFMSRVNRAYADGATETLHELAAEWERGPRPAEPDSELDRAELLYARLEWLAERKELLAAMTAELEESAIGAMLRMAPDDPDRLLEEIAEQLIAQVQEREAELVRLQAQLAEASQAGQAAETGRAGEAGEAGTGGGTG